MLVALNDISRQQVTFEILKGYSTLLPFLYLSDIKLEFLHTVYLQIILEYLFSTNNTVFVFALKFTLNDTGTCDRYHFDLFGPRILDLKNLCDRRRTHYIDIHIVSLFLLHLFFDVMDVVFYVFNELIDKFVLVHSDSLSLRGLGDYRVARDVKPEYDTTRRCSIAQVSLGNGTDTLVNHVYSVNPLDDLLNLLHQGF